MNIDRVGQASRLSTETVDLRGEPIFWEMTAAMFVE